MPASICGRSRARSCPLPGMRRSPNPDCPRSALARREIHCPQNSLAWARAVDFNFIRRSLTGHRATACRPSTFLLIPVGYGRQGFAFLICRVRTWAGYRRASCPEHDPDPKGRVSAKWVPVFPRDKRGAFARRSCSNKKLVRDDDSKKCHPALESVFRLAADEKRMTPCGAIPVSALAFVCSLSLRDGDV
jgi:hypothetical protein